MRNIYELQLKLIVFIELRNIFKNIQLFFEGLAYETKNSVEILLYNSQNLSSTSNNQKKLFSLEESVPVRIIHFSAQSQ